MLTIRSLNSVDHGHALTTMRHWFLPIMGAQSPTTRHRSSPPAQVPPRSALRSRPRGSDDHSLTTPNVPCTPRRTGESVSEPPLKSKDWTGRPSPTPGSCPKRHGERYASLQAMGSSRDNWQRELGIRVYPIPLPLVVPQMELRHPRLKNPHELREELLKIQLDRRSTCMLPSEPMVVAEYCHRIQTGQRARDESVGKMVGAQRRHRQSSQSSCAGASGRRTARRGQARPDSRWPTPRGRRS